MDVQRGSGAAVRMTRVVVVDDSRLMRELITAALTAEGDIDVVGAGADPFEARELIRATSPDVISLDVEMPRMGGLEFLRRIMALRPMPVVMVSTTTTAGADTTLAALEIGAIDFVAKPSKQADWIGFGQSLRAKVRAAAQVNFDLGAIVRGPQTGALFGDPAPPGPGAVAARGATAGQGGAISKAQGRLDIVAVGASTGGVTAINRLLAALPDGMPPLVIAQHMPRGFTARFADRLARTTGRDVAEAVDGEVLRSGAIRVAPGDRHLRIARFEGRIICNTGDDAPVRNYRPSVDALFSSVATVCGRRSVGVILTGMGRDGARGLLEMRTAGARTFGEAESSCIVYGMPRAAVRIGAVMDEYPVDDLATNLANYVCGTSGIGASRPD